MGKGVENEQSCPGVRSRAHGDLFWEAHSPLPAPPSEDKDQPCPHHGIGHPFQVPSCPVGAPEAAESPPKLTAHLLTGIRAGWPPPMWGAPSSHHHPLLWCLDVVGDPARGAELLVAQDWATGPHRFAQGAFATRPPAQPCRLHSAGPALPASSIRPGCRPRGELAAPTSVTGSLRTSNVTPGQFGGQWLPREAPRMPDA